MKEFLLSLLKSKRTYVLLLVGGLWCLKTFAGIDLGADLVDALSDGNLLGVGGFLMLITKILDSRK
jgi:hypothetical protein